MQNRSFTTEQQEWLLLIREHLIQNLTIGEEDLDIFPIFEQHGGKGRARRVFGDHLRPLIEELNLSIAAWKLMTDIVNKLWGFCHTLRHDGVDYGDYIEQLTYLLFLKMADERDIDLSKITWKNDKGETVQTDCSWPTLSSRSGTGLLDHFTDVMRVLGRQPGLLGQIFAQATPRFNQKAVVSGM